MASQFEFVRSPRMNGVCFDVTNGEIACIEVTGKKIQSYALHRLAPGGLRGFVDYLVENYDFIYVRGKSKAEFIRKMQKSAVTYDLADVGCPPLGVVADNMEGRDCLEHGGMEECALTNVRLMLQWLSLFQNVMVYNAVSSFKLTRGLKDMEVTDLCYLPKCYYLQCRQQIRDVIEKLPAYLRQDPDLAVYAREKQVV